MNFPGHFASRNLMPALALLLALAVSACSADEPPVQQTAQLDGPAPASIEPAAQADPPAPEPEGNGESDRLPEPTKVAALTDDPPEAQPPSRFKQGVHYNLLTPAQPTSSSPDKVEVAEVFWYGCGHCYTFEPYIENWLKRQDSNVAFVRIPVMWGAIHRIHARAFYTADLLGVLEDIHGDLFREINVNKNRLNTEDALQDFFAKHGVEPEEFEKAFRSFGMETKLKRADTLMRRYGADSTPLVIVNGKYTADGGSAGDFENLIALIDELVAREMKRQ